MLKAKLFAILLATLLPLSTIAIEITGSIEGVFYPNKNQNGVECKVRISYKFSTLMGEPTVYRTAEFKKGTWGYCSGYKFYSHQIPNWDEIKPVNAQDVSADVYVGGVFQCKYNFSSTIEEYDVTGSPNWSNIFENINADGAKWIFKNGFELRNLRIGNVNSEMSPCYRLSTEEKQAKFEGKDLMSKKSIDNINTEKNIEEHKNDALTRNYPKPITKAELPRNYDSEDPNSKLLQKTDYNYNNEEGNSEITELKKQKSQLVNSLELSIQKLKNAGTSQEIIQNVYQSQMSIIESFDKQISELEKNLINKNKTNDNQTAETTIPYSNERANENELNKKNNTNLSNQINQEIYEKIESQRVDLYNNLTSKYGLPPVDNISDNFEQTLSNQLQMKMQAENLNNYNELTQKLGLPPTSTLDENVIETFKNQLINKVKQQELDNYNKLSAQFGLPLVSSLESGYETAIKRQIVEKAVDKIFDIGKVNNSISTEGVVSDRDLGVALGVAAFAALSKPKEAKPLSFEEKLKIEEKKRIERENLFWFTKRKLYVDSVNNEFADSIKKSNINKYYFNFNSAGFSLPLRIGYAIGNWATFAEKSVAENYANGNFNAGLSFGLALSAPHATNIARRKYLSTVFSFDLMGVNFQETKFSKPIEAVEIESSYGGHILSANVMNPYFGIVVKVFKTLLVETGLKLAPTYAFNFPSNKTNYIIKTYPIGYPRIPLLERRTSINEEIRPTDEGKKGKFTIAVCPLTMITYKRLSVGLEFYFANYVVPYEKIVLINNSETITNFEAQVFQRNLNFVIRYSLNSPRSNLKKLYY